MTHKCQVEQEAPQVFRITLVQGLNRQIRRMCKYFGYQVTKLERVRIMNISLEGLALGEWRDLSEDERTELFKLLEHSSSEDPDLPQRIEIPPGNNNLLPNDTPL
ncbi:Ribosomal large subunit pseudouridine synthase F [compost metagenome]